MIVFQGQIEHIEPGVDNQPKSSLPRRRTDHLRAYQWKPGVSGNPRGRPRKKIITEHLHDILGEEVAPGETRLEVLLRKLVDRAEAGDLRTFVEIGDRLDPKLSRAELKHNCAGVFPTFTDMVGSVLSSITDGRLSLERAGELALEERRPLPIKGPVRD